MNALKTGRTKITFAVSAFTILVLLLGNGLAFVATAEPNVTSSSAPIKLGYVVMNDINYTVYEVITSQANVATGPNTVVSPSSPFTNDFQYGPQITDSYGEYGAQANFTIFDGGTNPSWFSSWVGAYDNLNYFYQAGIAYGPNCTPVYQIWAVDNYNGGSLNIGCSETSYHVVDAGGWLTVMIYVYQNQWYYCFDKDGTSSCATFPHGADDGSTISYYPEGGYKGAVVITEGSDNSTSGGNCPTGGAHCIYDQGATDENNLAYVNGFTVSGSTFTINITLTSNDHFAQYDSPPNSSAWSDSSGTCDQYFDYAAAGLPSNNAPISSC
jgi:hypothetical protein